MAFAYNEYTINGERTFYYRFTCGKCGKITDWRAETIKAKYKTAISAKGKQPSHEDVQNLLKSGLDKTLNDHMETIKGGAKRGYYFTAPPRTNAEYVYNLDSTCPFCGQKHKNKGGTAKAVRIGGLMGLFVGLIAFIIVMMSSKVYSFGDAIPSVIAFLAPILIGCMTGLYLGRKSNSERIVHTNVEYSWGATPPVKPVEP